MKIAIKDILTLGNKKRYGVVSKASYNDKDYLFLINILDNSDIKFCYQDNDEVVEVTDKTINTKLLPLFYIETKRVIESESN